MTSICIHIWPFLIVKECTFLGKAENIFNGARRQQINLQHVHVYCIMGFSELISITVENVFERAAASSVNHAICIFHFQ